MLPSGRPDTYGNTFGDGRESSRVAQNVILLTLVSRPSASAPDNQQHTDDDAYKDEIGDRDFWTMANAREADA